MDIVNLLYEFAGYGEKLALLFGLIFINKIWKTHSFAILIYLGLVLVVEFIGKGMSNNQWMYNLLGLSELFAVSYMFYFSVKELISKKIIIWILCLGILFLLIDFAFITKTFTQYLSYAFGFVSLGISLMCFCYLFEMAKTEKIIYQYRVLLYWLSIGLLVYHLCNLPITVLVNNFTKYGELNILYAIQSTASLLMYFCFIIGFILSKWKYNT